MVGNNSNLEIFNRIKETNANSADEYSNSKTYIKDEYCIYNNTLYKANQAIDTAEEFTESHWTETTVGTELKSQADSISALNSRIHTVYSGRNANAVNNQPFYTGISVTIPANSYYAITGRAYWNQARPDWVGLATNPNEIQYQRAEGTATQVAAACSMCGHTVTEITLYLWVQYPGASSNDCEITGFYISA